MDDSRSVFDHKDYRRYLEVRLPTEGPERGVRTRLAEKLKCQTAFISRVLHAQAHFSLEHAVQINDFLAHTEAESDYFMLLVHLARAGSRKLEEHYLKQIRFIQEKRQIVAERIQVKQTLSMEDQLIYYSAWYYAAVHILVLVPKYQTPEAIAAYLGMRGERVQEVLDFLASVGLVEHKGGKYLPGKARIHVARSSPCFPKHHMNWRMRSMQAVDRQSAEDLFFSGPIGLSEKDVARLRAKLLQFLEETEAIVGPSESEAVFCLALDLFRL